VEVCSEPGRGTTFKVYLPRVEEEVQPTKPFAFPFAGPRGNETVLLVEDDEAVRTLSRRILTASGYAVLEAAGGAEALRVCERHGGTIHLMVSDVVMPGMGGRQVAEQLAAAHPETKVLFVSGYTNDAVVRHGIREAEVHFLQKPFKSADLTRKVREVLDGVLANA
jgi:CheY-like chemotaxis protein